MVALQITSESDLPDRMHRCKRGAVAQRKITRWASHRNCPSNSAVLLPGFLHCAIELIECCLHVGHPLACGGCDVFHLALIATCDRCSNRIAVGWNRSTCSSRGRTLRDGVPGTGFLSRGFTRRHDGHPVRLSFLQDNLSM